MVAVIGTSFTVESAWKGLYENTIGRVTEWTVGSRQTDEDRFGADVARRYAEFIHATPWYEFPYLEQTLKLWREVPLMGGSSIRKLERRIALSFEYLVKAQYALLIRLGTKLVYGDEDNEVLALVENESAAALHETRMVIVERFADSTLVSLPRYDEFGSVVQRLIAQGVRFREISGNGRIVLTAIAPASWQAHVESSEPVFSQTILDDPERKRVGLTVPVQALHTVLPALEASGAKIEHVYDY